MKHTARSEPSLARPVPVTARLCPKQPDLAPVSPCISSLILDSWLGPGQGHSKISAWERVINRRTFNFIYFSKKKKSDCPENVHQNIPNISIKSGGSPKFEYWNIFRFSKLHIDFYYKRSIKNYNYISRVLCWP